MVHCKAEIDLAQKITIELTWQIASASIAFTISVSILLFSMGFVSWLS